MHAKRLKMSPLLLTIALVSSPAIVVAQDSAPATSSGPATFNPNAVAPDNTGRNIRDRSSDAVTPFTQSNKQSDVETTRRIRRALMADRSLSTTARNVKVVTVDGNVTLLGSVKSEHERKAIARRLFELPALVT